MPVSTSWLKYLWKERKSAVLPQVLRMARLHRTPFRTLLENILVVAEDYTAGYTFPITGSAASRNLEPVRLIGSFHQEVASHGFDHLNYRYLSSEAQREDMARSLSAFRELRIPIQGFRAPYNMYGDQTPRLLEEFGFLWDAGLGFTSPFSKLRRFFRAEVDGHESSYLCIPLSRWSDDRMIENHLLNNRQMAKLLKLVIRETHDERGVIMFDLHPIRIGQPRYVGLLSEILAYGIKLNGWFPTVTEAVEHWLKYEEWKDGASFCCLLTGDIDNFTFFEYMTRLF